MQNYYVSTRSSISVSCSGFASMKIDIVQHGNIVDFVEPSWHVNRHCLHRVEIACTKHATMSVLKIICTQNRLITFRSCWLIVDFKSTSCIQCRLHDVPMSITSCTLTCARHSFGTQAIIWGHMGQLLLEQAHKQQWRYQNLHSTHKRMDLYSYDAAVWCVLHYGSSFKVSASLRILQCLQKLQRFNVVQCRHRKPTWNTQNQCRYCVSKMT